MTPLRLLWLVAGSALLAIASTDAEALEQTHPACCFGTHFALSFTVVAVLARITQIATAQRPGSCVFGNRTLQEGSSTPDPGGACGLLHCERGIDGNLTINFVTCSNVPLERDFERDSKIYPFCCPYPDLEESV